MQRVFAYIQRPFDCHLHSLELHKSRRECEIINK